MKVVKLNYSHPTKLQNVSLCFTPLSVFAPLFLLLNLANHQREGPFTRAWYCSEVSSC